MHLWFLYLHSWNRWLLLIFGLLFLIKTSLAKFRNEKENKTEKIINLAFLISIDTQFLLGLILYSLYSAEVKAAFSNLALAMKEPLLRFYAVEHIFTGFISLLLLHVGNVLARKRKDFAKSRNIRLIFYSLSLFFVLLTIPWPFREIVGRPLFRF